MYKMTDTVGPFKFCVCSKSPDQTEEQGAGLLMIIRNAIDTEVYS